MNQAKVAYIQEMERNCEKFTEETERTATINLFNLLQITITWRD